MTKINDAANSLRILGDEGDAAASYLLQLDPGKTEEDRIEIARNVYERKAEQYRGFKGVSSSARAETYRRVADALAAYNAGTNGDMDELFNALFCVKAA